MQTNTLTGMEKTRRALSSFASLVVGGASFALSYVALSEVSVRVGAVPAGLGWLVPIVVDGGVICGSAIIWSHSKESASRPFFPFFFVGSLVVISVIINASHAGPSYLAKGIASLPPLVLLGTLELVASQGRRDRRNVPTGQFVDGGALATQPAPQAPVAPSFAQVQTQQVSTLVAAPVAAPAARPAPSAVTAGPSAPADWVRDSLDVELDTLTTGRKTSGNRRAVRVRAEEPIA